ncbi:MAG: hypothetical protein U1D55_03345 [Phycisphaerae bacterium]
MTQALHSLERGVGAAPASAFVPLPVRGGELLRALAPAGGDGASVLTPLAPVGGAIGPIQAYFGAMCDAHGRPTELIEILTVADPAATPPSTLVPQGAPVRALAGVAFLADAVRGVKLPLDEVVRSATRISGPVVFCRKRRCIFELRSPGNRAPLRTASDVAPDAPAAPAAETQVEPEFVCLGASDDERFSAAGGSTALGPSRPFDQLILEQGRIVSDASELSVADASAYAELAAAHACIRCDERRRCYDQTGYAFASDRLVGVHFAVAPLVLLPLGMWRLSEAAAILGGASAHRIAERGDDDADEVRQLRNETARQYATSGPARLLGGEGDARELIEIARVKLALIADVLEQLDRVWRSAGRPHLIWRDDSVRVAWQRPATTPAAAWGFSPILRHLALHSLSPQDFGDAPPMPYPPAFSAAEWLAPEVADALRYFGESRTANVFVKTAQVRAGVANVNILLEDFGAAWALFASGDVVLVEHSGWKLKLKPADTRNPDDGAGLPFVGQGGGAVDPLKAGSQHERANCRWYSRFGEAVDLFAVGQMLAETLACTDERAAPALRDALRRQRAELTAACLALPVEQREKRVSSWVAERAASDSPGEVWTRRNLLFAREGRAAAVLDGFAGPLWQAAIHIAWRMMTWIPGYSYCRDRSSSAPRTPDGLLVPLQELRGLIALLDDRLFGRAAPSAALTKSLDTPGRGA